MVGDWSPYNCTLVTSKKSFYNCAVYSVCFLNLFGLFIWTQRLKCQCFKLDQFFKGRTQWLFSTYLFTIHIWHCKTRRQINKKIQLTFQANLIYPVPQVFCVSDVKYYFHMINTCAVPGKLAVVSQMHRAQPRLCTGTQLPLLYTPSLCHIRLSPITVKKYREITVMPFPLSCCWIKSHVPSLWTASETFYGHKGVLNYAYICVFVLL